MSLVTRGMGPGPLVTAGLGIAVLIVASAICPERLTVFRAVNLTSVPYITDRTTVEYDPSLIVAVTRVRDMVEQRIDRGVIGYAIDSQRVLENKNATTIGYLVDGATVTKVTDRELIALMIDQVRPSAVLDSTLTFNDHDRDQVELILEQTQKGC
jgi:hypothetical protein